MQNQTLFSEVTFPLGTLIGDIESGLLALPDLQRPFVWPNKKVRDLLDSMFRGYPVGYLLLWDSADAKAGKVIGTGRKGAAPSLLIIDGQQRLTSLYAVLRGAPVKRENFHEERIQIAFRPLDGQFEVADAATRKDPRWIPDISEIWDPTRGVFDLTNSYLEGLAGDPEIDALARRRIADNINRLAQLTNFPFTALQLSSDLDEEQVAQVFVRINSQGKSLNQADFILTLMSVFRDAQRKKLEEFCRNSRSLAARGEASPYNPFLAPDPDHLLRVAVGLGFRRARLQNVYSILRGKDLETGQFSPERREAQFQILDEAQKYTLDLQTWHEFFKVLQDAGYRSGQLISSRNAILYTYIYYLIARRDYRLGYRQLAAPLARWFFFVSLTGRYTDSPETRMEQDLADLRDVKTGEDLLAHLDRTIRATFTPDFWEITLPNQLATSSAGSPGLFAYYAALVLLDARVLFSNRRVTDLLDPMIHAPRKAVERHHLFPKAYLKKLGIGAVRETNQIANFALVEWPENTAIGAKPPKEYFPSSRAGLSSTDWERQTYWHALPEGWAELSYGDFLTARRQLMARVIQAGYEALDRGALVADRAPVPTEPRRKGIPAVLASLSNESRAVFSSLLDEPVADPADLLQEVDAYVEELEKAVEEGADLDLDRGRRAAERCRAMLAEKYRSEEAQWLVQAAVRYFVLAEDAERDRDTFGFHDDEEVLGVVELALAEEPGRK